MADATGDGIRELEIMKRPCIPLQDRVWLNFTMYD